MNQEWLFQVEAYVKDEPKETAMVGHGVATGSTEDRARRRLLFGLHSNNMFARSVTLLKSRPASRPQQ